MKKKVLIIIVLITLTFLLMTACKNEAKVPEANFHDVSFTINQNTSRSVGLSTGISENSVSFSELTNHKMKLECVDGTGYCSLSGATEGFVDWPKSSVTLGYGKWIVKAEGYKNADKYYENADGLTFIVGPKGVSVDDGTTWNTTVSIEETYCSSDPGLFKANLSIAVRNEEGEIVELGSGQYESFMTMWFRSDEESPLNITSAFTISDLASEGTGFVEWINPSSPTIQADTKYVLVAIVDKNSPSTIFGSVAVNVDVLTAGQTYTIGSGEYDCVQFGKYSVNFDEPTYYTIGSIGPAGGFIFYDCDADNVGNDAGPDGLKSSVCGWKFLEAAPNDIYIVDPNDLGAGIRNISEGHIGLVFGTLIDENYKGYDWSDYYINGTTTYNPEDCTKTGIGEGFRNTRLIVDAFGETTRWDHSDTSMATHYAAKECYNYSIAVGDRIVDDWFLPSKDELNLLYKNIIAKGTEGFERDWGIYWSSSESSYCAAWFLSIKNASMNHELKTARYNTRPVRAFSIDCPYGHNFSETIIQQYDCTADEVTRYTCTHCGYSYEYVTRRAKGHTYETEYSGDDTYHWYATTCGHEDAVEKVAHTLINPVLLKETTPSSDGLISMSCKVCSLPIRKEIPASTCIVGPAGGYVFYDCDADNDETNNGAGPDGLKSDTCGWRYLEAAPTDMYLSSYSNYSNPKVGGTVSNYCYFSISGNEETDSKVYSQTSPGLGLGKKNTSNIISILDNAGVTGAYVYSSDGSICLNSSSTNCVERVVNRLTYGGYSDWYLPSITELEMMNTVLVENGIGNFLCNTPYISSTSSYYYYDREYKEYEYYRDEGYFSLLGNFSARKESDCCFRVRPIRRYL